MRDVMQREGGRVQCNENVRVELCFNRVRLISIHIALGMLRAREHARSNILEEPHWIYFFRFILEQIPHMTCVCFK